MPSPSGGYWATLAEAQKLTQPFLIPGIVEEDVKRANPADLFPVAQAAHTGSSIKWLRESTTTEGDVANLGVGGQTVLTASQEYDAQEVSLKICYQYKKLDKYVQTIYGTFNNYEEIVLKGMVKGCKRALGEKMIYDDYTYDSNSLQMDGLHAWAAVQTGTDLDLDAGEIALSLAKWRKLYYAMKYGVDFWLIPFELQKHIDAAYQEKGFVGLKSSVAGTMGGITWAANEMGKPIPYFMNAPLVPTDYLLAEKINTGEGSDARTKWAVAGDGVKQYSLFGVKLGKASLAEEDPGIKLAFGQTEEDGEFFNLEYFERLEGYIGKAMRLSSFTEIILGSKMCLGRIYDFTDASLTV